MATDHAGARTWAEVPVVPPPGVATASNRWSGTVVRLVVLLLLAQAMAAEEDLRRALAVRMVALLVTLVAVASRRLARVLDLPFAWGWGALRWSAWSSGAILLEGVFSLPARAAGRLLRREPIGWRPLAAESTWVVREPTASRRPGFEGDAPLAGSASGRGAVRMALRPIVVLLALLLGIDAIAGSALAAANDVPAGGSTSRLALAAEPQPPGTVAPYVDARAQHPAFASSPWAEDYFREFRSQDYEGVPYVQSRYRDRSGRYVNVEGNVRRTVAADDGPVVWFFGGSTMFGEGQRDAHTIPSEVARMAMADGHGIQAVNFGVQADSDFQSVLRFEAALASPRPGPDLVVFYDGANEISQHISQPATDQPQYYQGPGGPSSPDSDGGLLDAWGRTSLLGQVLDSADGRGSPLPAPPATLVEQITSVYRRGLDLARALAVKEDIAFASFFQPAKLYDDLTWVDQVRVRLPNGTVDLADVLDGAGEATYFDAVHTNEAGARLVAEAIYGHLADQIAGLDR